MLFVDLAVCFFSELILVSEGYQVDLAVDLFLLLFLRAGPAVLAVVVSELVLVSEGYQAALAVCCSCCCFRVGPGV